MVGLSILLLSGIISLLALPFWLFESQREKERHARALEAAAQENARYQAEMAHRAWLSHQAAEQHRAMQAAQGGEAAQQQHPDQPGPPPRWS